MIHHRRGFLAAGGALLGTAACVTTPQSGAARPASGVIVNALGGLGDPNRTAGPPAATYRPQPPSPRAIADALASGASAVNLTLGYVFGEAEPYGETLAQLDHWDGVIADHPELLKVLTAADIRRAHAERRLGVIYGFQNAAMLGDDVARVDAFARRGVRIVQLTYNGENQLGGGALTPVDPGLSAFGRRAVERLNEQSLIIDLSHSGERTCLDAAEASAAPIAITHTGCRALVDLPRNKTDAELRLVASRGGFVGIYFMPFLALDRQATADDVVAHIEHAIQVCGEDQVGVGTDGGFTGIDDMDAYRVHLERDIARRRAAGISAPGERPDIVPFVPELTGPEQFRELARRLARRGHSAARIDRILGLNFLRYAETVWGG